MRRRKKFHIIIPALALAAVLAAILYIRVVEYTISARSLLVDEIGRATGKKAFCTDVRFDPLKGLVMERVVLHDGKRVIIRASRVSSGLLIPSFIAKKVIVPAITITSPRIYVERRPDGSLNLFDLIPKDYVARSGMAVSLHKIMVRRGTVVFVDRTASPELVKNLTDFELEVKLYLPVRATFRSSFNIPASTPLRVSGEYVIPTEIMSADIASEKFSLRDFAYYYRSSGFSFPEGTASLRAAAIIKPGTAYANVTVSAKDLLVVNGGLRARGDCRIKATLKYDAASRLSDCSGEVEVARMDIDGLLPAASPGAHDGSGKLRNITARANFDRTRLFSDDVRAEALGMSWNARINIVDFLNPIVDIYARSAVHLGALEEALRKEMGLKLPTEMAGKGDLRVSIQAEPGSKMKINGSLLVDDATARLGRGNFPIEKIKGEFRFGADELSWQGVKASYKGTGYISGGRLKDFASPRVELEVASKDLSYTSSLSVTGSAVSIAKLKGRYFNSAFSLKGDVGLEDPDAAEADIKGTADIDLADLRSIFPDAAGVRKMKPYGKLRAEFEMSGDAKNLRSCYVNARLKSESISVYGVKMSQATLAYTQEQGVGNIGSFRSDLYGGTMAVSGNIDWLGKGVPYSVKLDAIGVRMGLLKEDTGFKDKEVSGDIKVYADIKGYFKDASRLKGIGHAGISNGRLWQLNLFKGAGTLIFNRDFSDIVFTEGACDWKLEGQDFFIENLIMKSDVLTLRGAGRIGLDRSVEGTIRPEVDEYVADRGTLASAVGKGTVIEVGGTLKDPVFRTRTNVIDVVGAMLQQQ